MPESATGQSHGRPAHLLIVDDEADIRAVAQQYFHAHGFHVRGAGDGTAMRRALAEGDVDLVLLDLGLPGEDGLGLARYLRERWGGPFIILTGRGGAVDRIVGLELGADDYVTKPFELRELLARVRNLLRRTHGQRIDHAGVLRFAGFSLDTAARQLTREDGSSVPLTAGEYALLRAFLDQPQRVLSRDDLMTSTHGRDSGPYDRTIDVQIGRLRRKIEVDPARPQIIKSVRGVGYLFAAPLQQRE
jgi:two-component system OmpR family response regulator